METFNNDNGVRSMAQSARPWIMLVAVVLSLFLVAKTVSELRYPVGDNTPNPTIVVSGKGEVYIKPDIATVSFAVTAESLDISKAQTQSAEKINAIIAELKKLGINEKDIKTTNYNMYPRYEYQKSTAVYPYDSGKQILAAYVVTQGITVKVRDLTKSGVVISSLGGLGATDISGLSFEVDNDDVVKAQARAQAIADAKVKAEVMAKALGVRLVKITGFSEDAYYPYAYKTMATDVRAMGGASVVPEMPTGENLVTSNVTVTYEIR